MSYFTIVTEPGGWKPQPDPYGDTKPSKKLPRHIYWTKRPSSTPNSWPLHHFTAWYEAYSVRPYRYPFFQKVEIERIFKELLATGVIQSSQSPYSSPILLVRKADSSWRLCVDYMVLNVVTIKDKYPILVAKEPLEELHGETIFFKPDLRSSFYQISVKPEDVPKTAFWTHESTMSF